MDFTWLQWILGIGVCLFGIWVYSYIKETDDAIDEAFRKLPPEERIVALEKFINSLPIGDMNFAKQQLLSMNMLEETKKEIEAKKRRVV